MKDKYLILTILFLFGSNIVNSQSKYSEGFDDGYKNGYCQDQGVGCIQPIPPIAPLPQVGENLSSYKDGYNRGFELGLNARKSNKSSSSTNVPNRSRYQTARPIFVENKMSNPYGNIDNEIALANALRDSKGRAVEHLENEEYQEAANISFAGLRVAPKDDEFMIIIGQAYYMNGDLDNAIQWLKKASKLRPNDYNLRRDIYELEDDILKERTTNSLSPNSEIFLQKAVRDVNLKNETVSPDEFAIINIYRPKKMVGALIGVDILVNGRVVETIQNGGYLEYKVHNLSATEIAIRSAGLATLRLIPQKGETYYFKTNATLTGFSLEQINSPVSEKELKSKNYSKKADYIF